MSVKRYDCTSGGARFCQGCYTMTETELGDYVASEDYDALQSLNAELLEALEECRLELAAYEHEASGEQYNNPKLNELIAKARSHA